MTHKRVKMLDLITRFESCLLLITSFFLSKIQIKPEVIKDIQFKAQIGPIRRNCCEE
ncbi:MAG: hypothetical protein Q7U04_10335 [Bacteriovorax sp.]|nr:hypothetical protein [Bacteriovorax sp.]